MRPSTWLVVAALVLGACASGTPGAAVPAATTPPLPTGATGTPVSPATPVPGATGSATQLAAFLSMPLIDVRSGERFTLGDFTGKVTVVEGMAVW